MHWLRYLCVFARHMLWVDAECELLTCFHHHRGLFRPTRSPPLALGPPSLLDPPSWAASSDFARHASLVRLGDRLFPARVVYCRGFRLNRRSHGLCPAADCVDASCYLSVRHHCGRARSHSKRRGL